MQWKVDRIISVATLATSAVALVLVLKKPQPVAPPLTPAAVAANAQSFGAKLEQLEQPKEPGRDPAQVHLSTDEVNSALAQAVQAVPAAMMQQQVPGAQSAAANPTAPHQAVAQNPLSSPDAAFASGEPDVKDYQVSFEGDLAKGQFLTEVGGKTVWVTLAGHLASKDGYATFDPTEFKVGDLDVPVALVNDALQKKLGEQKDRLKLPENVGGMKVENGELVLTQR